MRLTRRNILAGIIAFTCVFSGNSFANDEEVRQYIRDNVEEICTYAGEAYVDYAEALAVGSHSHSKARIAAWEALPPWWSEQLRAVIAQATASQWRDKDNAATGWVARGRFYNHLKSFGGIRRKGQVDAYVEGCLESMHEGLN